MLKVLVVDDSSLARMMIKKCLEIADANDEMEFAEAANGNIALELARGQEFDLVVSDLNMPECSGERFLEEIQKSSELKGLPIIIISSKSNEAKRDELMSGGAVAVIRKPVTPASMFKIITDLKAEGVLK